MSEIESDQRQFLIKTFYLFTPIEEGRLPDMQSELLRLGQGLELTGSLLLSDEGCNATIAGRPAAVDEFMRALQRYFPGLQGQDSYTDRSPFQRFKVPIKKQIVQARDAELRPSTNFSGQLKAEEWDRIRKKVRTGEAQMLDVRNRYEVAIGTFHEATNPDTNTFKEFSDYLDREVGRSLDPELPTAIFCTGGIRCEKARMDLERRGFKDVLQLKGGILGYFKDSREQAFQGECFVFDERVAVDSRLNPSEKYLLCSVCGGPRPRDGSWHDCNNGRRPL